jgi:hypothetical protein
VLLPTRASHRAATAGAVALTGLLITGCGGSSGSAAGSVAPATPSAAQGGSGPTQPGQTGQPGQGGPPGFGGADFQKIQECLAAAGVSLPTPSGRPSGAPTGPPPSGFPSGAPTGPPPSGFPSGGTGGGPGGGGRLFADPKVRAALQACGIDLPTGAPSAPPATTS